MKRFLFLLSMTVLVLSCVAPIDGAVTYDQAYYSRQKAYLGAGNFNDPLWNFWGEAEGYLGAEGTGTTYYVDSSVSVEGDGTSWTNAKDTLDEAINLCTANNGDVIEIAQGHAENLAAADAVDADVAGITIKGQGNGSLVPTFTYTAAAGEFVIGAAGVKIQNLRFVAGVSAVIMGISVEAAGDYFTMEGCEFVNPATGTYEFYDMVDLASGADYAAIVGNKFHSTVGSTGCNEAIDISAGVVARFTAIGNDFQGAFAVSAIYSNQVNTDMLIVGNVVKQATASQFCIEFTGAATGIIANNLCNAATEDYEVDPGSCLAWNNNEGANMPEGTGLYDLVGTLKDAAAGTGVYPTGITDDSILAILMSKSGTAAASSYDNTTDSFEALSDKITAVDDYVDSEVAAIAADADAQDSEAEWADLSSTVVDNIVLAVDANSVIQGLALSGTPTANSLSTFIASGGTSLGTALPVSTSLYDVTKNVSTVGVTGAPTASTLADTLHKDGGFTYDNTTDSLEAIRDNIDTLNTADQVDLDAILADTGAMDTEAEWADLGSTLVDNVQGAMDANSLLYWQERTVSQTVANNCSSDDLFDVAGGPILITNFVAIVIEQVDANVATLKIMVDRDDTAADTDFTTAVAVDTDVLGTVYVFTDANPAVLTPLTPGSVGSSTLMSPWFCPEGMIESVFSAANLDGQIRYYLTWKPLAAGVTVTAQ